jgi:hypothetical protein
MIIDYLTTGLAGFDTQEFPEARDFTVELTPSEYGLRLAYIVSCPPIVVEWGWVKATDAEIRASTIADLLCGTLKRPYHDSDQGWNIMVWQMDNCVFIADGDGVWDEERDSNTYTTWFKVSSELYYAAWTKALAQLRAD